MITILIFDTPENIETGENQRFTKLIHCSVLPVFEFLLLHDLLKYDIS